VVNEVLVGILVLITGYYAWQNRKMVKEMQKARKAQFLPRLKLSLAFLGPTIGIPRVTNIGPGPAIKPYIEIWVEPSKEDKKIFSSPVMLPGQYQDFFYPESDNNLLSLDELEKLDTLKLKAKYFDIFDKEHEIEDSINLKEYIKILKTSSARYHEDEISKIRKEIELIRKSTEKIANFLKK
jgi:hypothetical protein